MDDETLVLDGDGVASEEQSEAEGTGCYSRVKKGRFVPLLELRHFNGNAMGLRYTHMHPITFNKSNGIIIDAPPVRVLIKGRNLKGLWRYLLQESVSWIKELPLEFDNLDEAETVIHSIEVVNGAMDQDDEDSYAESA